MLSLFFISFFFIPFVYLYKIRSSIPHITHIESFIEHNTLQSKVLELRELNNFFPSIYDHIKITYWVNHEEYILATHQQFIWPPCATEYSEAWIKNATFTNNDSFTIDITDDLKQYAGPSYNFHSLEFNPNWIPESHFFENLIIKDYDQHTFTFNLLNKKETSLIPLHTIHNVTFVIN